LTPNPVGWDASAVAAIEVQRVLVVEDRRELRRTLERALAERFPEVRTAASVAEAVALLASFRPELLLLDVELPDGTAVDVMEAAIRGESVPIAVAMSGRAGPSESFDLARLGVRTYLPKPIDLAVLERAIDAAISTPPDLGPHVRSSVGQRAIHEVQEEVRDTMLREALGRAGGSRRAAAKLLRVSRQLVQHMLRRFDDT
jgi:DNA-binding NtrC family response regulator